MTILGFPISVLMSVCFLASLTCNFSVRGAQASLRESIAIFAFFAVGWLAVLHLGLVVYVILAWSK